MDKRRLHAVGAPHCQRRRATLTTEMVGVALLRDGQKLDDQGGEAADSQDSARGPDQIDPASTA